MTDARAAVLGRIRAALGPAPAVPEIPREYRGPGMDDAGDLPDRFIARVSDYRATVQESVAAALAARGFARIACAPGLDLDLPGVELVRDDPPLSADALLALDGIVTGCAVAVAETGTLVLDASPPCGRRALTLIPDYHLCVVRADQIVAGVPDAIASLDAAARAGRPITMISGPSATSDIELERVEGVHGPRTLDVVVVA